MKYDPLKSMSMLLLSSCMLLACGGGQKKASSAVGSDSVEAEGVKTIQVDSLRVTWIKDNAGDKLMPRSLFPDAPDGVIEELGLQNGIPSTVSVFLAETPAGRILFDTGLGAPDSGLLEGLKALGLTPSDIQYVYLTHFHGDHIGGMLQADTVAFPAAEVYASKAEYDAWMERPAEKKAQVADVLGRYKERLHLFQFGDALPGGVVAVDAVGHTPGHTAFRLGRVLVVGDLMHGAALQKPHPEYCASYDESKEQAIAARKRLLKEVADKGLVMAGMHFPAPAFDLP